MSLRNNAGASAAGDVGLPATANAFTDPDIRCGCSVNHQPKVITWHLHHVWPLGMGGPDEEWNTVWLCPTSHASVHHLLRAWVKHDGPPSWSLRRRFGPHVRILAETGFERWVKAGSP